MEIDNNKIYTIITKDNSKINVNNDFMNMIGKKNYPENQIFLDITNYSLNLFIQYCNIHNYKICNDVIKRPLKDDFKSNIQNEQDSQLINKISFEQIIPLIKDAYILGNSHFLDLCITKLALLLRCSDISNFFGFFGINENEFGIDIINNVLKDNEQLLTICDERVQELLNDS